MKRRGFLGAMLGIPAIPVAAKAISELEKFDAPLKTASKVAEPTAFTALPMSMCSVSYMPEAIASLSSVSDETDW